MANVKGVVAKTNSSINNNQAFFSIFTQLAEHKDATRIKACERILNEISTPDELSYSIKRLVRGLSSSRAAARQGFALALCSLIKNGRVENVEEAVLNELEKDTKLSKKERGEEERDKLIGRGFGYLSLIRSSNLNFSCQIRVLKGLSELSQEKSWVRELCANAVCALLNSMIQAKAIKDETIAEIETALLLFLKGAQQDESVRDPETIAILVALERLSGRFQLLTKEKLKSLAKPLATAWRASPLRLHVVWDQLCQACVSLDMARDLWLDVVEPALLRGGLVSPERKCAGFLAFSRLVSILCLSKKYPQIAEYMLTPACIGSMINHAKSQTKTLNQPARNALNSLANEITAVGVPSETQLAVLKGLLRFGDFDGRTNTDTCQRLLRSLDEPAANNHFEWLKQQVISSRRAWAVSGLVDLARAQASKPVERQVMLFLFEFGYFEEIDSDGKRVVTATTATSKSKKKDTTDDTEDEGGAAEDEDDEPVGVDLTRRSRQRFFTVLSRVVKAKAQDEVIKTLRELHSVWTTKTSSSIAAASSKKKSTSKTSAGDARSFRTLRPDTDDVKSHLKSCRDTADWLASSQVGEMHQKIIQAFECLILFIGLMLIVPVPVEGEEAENDDEKEESEFLKIDVGDLVEDLKEASQRIISSLASGRVKATPKKKGGKASKQDDDENDDDPVAVTVDIMLALLGQPSTLIRDMVTNLSKAMASNIANSKPALDTLMEVLTKSHQPVPSKATDEEDEDEVEMEPSDDDEDDQEVGDEAAKESKPVPKKGKSQQQKAAPVESDDEDEEEESEEEDEEEAFREMEMYDRTLSEYLKQRKASSQKAKESALIAEEKQEITFKLRVLDIIEAIVSRSSDHKNVLLSLPLALLKAAEVALPTKNTSKKKQLSGPAQALFSRLQSVQRKLYKSKSLPEDGFGGASNAKAFEDLFQGVTDLINNAKNKELARLGIEAISYIIRVARKTEKLAARLVDLLPALFSPLIKTIFLGHSNHQLVDVKIFQQEFVDKYPDLAWQTSLKVLCELQARTPFQRSEQINLVSRMLKLRKDTIPTEDSDQLRAFALQVLQKEEEDLVKGKSNAGRVRSTLKFVQQIQAIYSSPEFTSQLEEVFLKLIKASDSPAVKQLLLAMSSSKSELEAVAAATAAEQQQKASSQPNKKRPIDETGSSQTAAESAEQAAALAKHKSKRAKKTKQQAVNATFFEDTNGTATAEKVEDEEEADEGEDKDDDSSGKKDKKKKKKRSRDSSDEVGEENGGDAATGDASPSKKKHRKDKKRSKKASSKTDE